MWIIITSLLAGGLTGYLFRNIKKFNFTAEKISNLLIYVLLFFMGLSVGVNPEIMNNLKNLGITAIIIAVFTISGSIIFAFLSEKFLFKKKKT
jgi:uncharacterized membrane protein YbjE (DUF340 family)